MSKYDEIPASEREVLPNKWGITDAGLIAEKELEGFDKAFERFIDELTDKTVFNCAYLQRLHLLALGEIYDFAGKWRTVNVSKANFTFPFAGTIDAAMKDWQKKFIRDILFDENNLDEFCMNLGRTHAELLFIHPFREGNGRTARIFAQLQALKAGFPRILNFKSVEDRHPNASSKFMDYVAAVQAASVVKYQPMIDLFKNDFCQ